MCGRTLPPGQNTDRPQKCVPRSFPRYQRRSGLRPHNTAAALLYPGLRAERLEGWIRAGARANENEIWLLVIARRPVGPVDSVGGGDWDELTR